MTRFTEAPGETGLTTDGGREARTFEAAQRDLLEAAGLDARSRFVDLEAPRVRTHVLEAGSPGDDPPLLFVHGTAAFGAVLAPVMAHLQGVRMVTFDRPGYGLSDPFVYTERHVRRTFVDSIEGVLDALGIDRVDVVGHSAGGHAGIRFALAHPDRVRRLILLGAVPAFPGTQPPVPLRLLTVPLLGRVLRRVQRGGEAGVLDVAAVLGERDAVRERPAFVHALAAHDAVPTSAEAGTSEFRALFSVRGWHSSVRLREAELRTLGARTLAVVGRRDPLGGPADVRDDVAAIPTARLEVLDAGHIPFLAHAERCARLVEEARGSRTTDAG